jgi:hypothetical protein
MQYIEIEFLYKNSLKPTKNFAQFAKFGKPQGSKFEAILVPFYPGKHNKLFNKAIRKLSIEEQKTLAPYFLSVVLNKSRSSR